MLIAAEGDSESGWSAALIWIEPPCQGRGCSTSQTAGSYLRQPNPFRHLLISLNFCSTRRVPHSRCFVGSAWYLLALPFVHCSQGPLARPRCRTPAVQSLPSAPPHSCLGPEEVEQKKRGKIPSAPRLIPLCLNTLAHPCGVALSPDEKNIYASRLGTL